jgi:hypothetical protein
MLRKAVFIVLLLALAACGSPRQLTLIVDGSGKALLTVSDGHPVNATTKEVNLPYTENFIVPGGEYRFYGVSSRESDGIISCKITGDRGTVSEQSSRGQGQGYGNVSCSSH